MSLYRPGDGGNSFVATKYRRDGLEPVTILNKIAFAAQQRIMLMLNNTELTKHCPAGSMSDVLLYLQGMHEDVGMSGDRGDFYRRKLAEELYTTFAVDGIDHNNITIIVNAAMKLERDTKNILQDYSQGDNVQYVDIDNQTLNVLARIAGMH